MMNFAWAHSLFAEVSKVTSPRKRFFSQVSRHSTFLSHALTLFEPSEPEGYLMKLLIFQPLIERRYYSYITRREFWPQAAFWVNVQKLLHAISRYSGFKAKLCKTLLYSGIQAKLCTTFAALAWLLGLSACLNAYDSHLVSHSHVFSGVLWPYTLISLDPNGNTSWLCDPKWESYALE